MVLGRWQFATTLWFLAACGGTTNASFDQAGDASTGGAGGDASSGGGAGACKACVTDKDCGGGSVCAQFASDTYCATPCPSGNECSGDTACTTLSTASGDQTNACVPRSDICGPSSGPGSARDGGSSSGGSDAGTCGALAGPNVSAKCASCGSHTCQPNGCYGGWYCNTTTSKCQSPPASCTGGGNGGGGGGNGGGGGGTPGTYDAGGPASGNVGPNGGTVSRLFFGVVGDTRPATIDDTAGYPTAVVTGIYGAMQAASPSPIFAVTTGDYMFATANGTQASPQLDLYEGARAKFSGTVFPAMGNHECTGMTASNCGQGQVDGVTVNYTTFLQRMLAPLQKTNPYYAVNVNAIDNSWTAKFVFVAANAWDATQSSWLSAALAQPTTYTFVVRHEPASASTAPGVAPSEQIMAQHPYTLAIVGHTHTYGKTGTKQITVGNGGAPLSGSGTYGYGLISQRADGALDVDMIDYATGKADTSFHFAVKPDGTVTQ